MDQNFQTSFIPKRALAEDRIERPKSVSVFLFFATIIFIASLIGAGFVYFYKTSLTNQVAQMKIDLQKAEAAFEGDFIRLLQRTDKRINAANAVLSDHISVTPIFNELRDSTLKSIQFTKFSYTITGSGPTAKITIQMSGKSQSYTAIALQSAKLAENKDIKDPIFSNLTPNDQGIVLFDLTFNVDPQFVLYRTVLAQTSIAPTSNPPTTQQGATNGGSVSFPVSNQ